VNHDDNGNRALRSGGAWGTQSYAYDWDDRLRRVIVGAGIPGDAAVDFGYDAGGRRTVETRGTLNAGGQLINTQVTRFYSDTYQVSGAVAHKYYLAGGMLIASRQAAAPAWLQVASLGTDAVQVAGLGRGVPGLVVGISPAAAAAGGAVVLGLVGVCLLAPGARRRGTFGLRLCAGDAVLCAVIIGTGALPAPLLLRPVQAQCDPTPSPTPVPNAEVHHYHLDHLGSPQVVTEGTGQIVRQVRYDPYGGIRGRWGALAAFNEQDRREFTGYHSEPLSELAYAGARFYDHRLASFLTHDPARQFANPYAYGPWDPVNGTDPTGTIFGLDDLAIVVIVGLVAGFAASSIQAAISGASVGEALQAGAIGGAIGGVAAGIGFLVVPHVSAVLATLISKTAGAALVPALFVSGLGQAGYGASQGDFTGVIGLGVSIGMGFALAQGANGGISQQEQLNLGAEQFGLRFSTPFQRAGGYAWNMLRGDVLDLVGGVYGTARGIGQGLYNIGAGLATLNPARIGQGFYDLVSPAVLRLGSHGGLNYPGTPDNSSPFPSTGTKPNNASIIHDLDVAQTGFSHSAPHFRWIANAWGGPGVEPGFYGQAYRLVGTAGFGAAGGVLRVFGR